MDSGSSVRVVESCLVTPSDDTPREGLWLSALDLVLANRGHTPLVHFYSTAGAGSDVADDFFDVARLKESMARALVPFYPLAGRLGVDSGGRTEVNCNGEGALFVVARSDHTLQDFVDPTPSPELRRLFGPRVHPSSIVLAVQVTFLRCGGVVLGTAVHHAVVDGASTFQFLRTWASYSRDGESAAVDPPCHHRALLRARSPPVIHPETIPMFCNELIMHEQEPSSSTGTTTSSTVVSRDEDPHRLQGPATRPEAPLRRRQHVLRRDGPRVAVRLRSPARPAPGLHHAHQLPGGHQAPPDAAAPGRLLRQRGRQRVRHGRGEGRGVADAGLRRRPGQSRRGPGRRRAAQVGGGLLRGDGEAGRAAAGGGQGEPAGDGAADEQLVPHPGARRGLRVGAAARDEPGGGCARRVGVPVRRLRRRQRARAHLLGGGDSPQVPARRR
ncbi:hypothetical protein CFC21_014736 [Triticum aestivum]|uniref:Uncharacterized protein n=2 Tax=Triticum aestivum TaxID=4565 RepID=A0A3B6AR39_WHEAT|nr:hypothetical protein CFC21_014736 [Triticum aestivum]